LERNQYPFDVSMRRGLRGGAYNYPHPLPHDQTSLNDTAPSSRPASNTSRKYVQGIPSLYSRASHTTPASLMQPTVEAEAAAYEGGGSTTAQRLLLAAELRGHSDVVSHAAVGSVQEDVQLRHQESALQARLRAMVRFPCRGFPCCTSPSCSV